MTRTLMEISSSSRNDFIFRGRPLMMNRVRGAVNPAANDDSGRRALNE